jgi:hypothetical protein
VSDTTVVASTTDGSDAGNTGGDQSASGSAEFKPITSQDELNKALSERLTRERNKVSARFADYDEVKAKAAEFDKLADANKSEIEKLTDRVTKAESEAAKLPERVADQLRTHLIAVHEINADDAELFLTAKDPEVLIKQAERLVGREKDRKKQGNHVTREGTNTNAATSDERETARRLFSSD